MPALNFEIMGKSYSPFGMSRLKVDVRMECSICFCGLVSVAQSDHLELSDPCFSSNKFWAFLYSCSIFTDFKKKGLQDIHI